jgi:membrane protein required for colicin V production
MNYLDFIILLPAAWFAFKGFSRGLVLELTSLIGLILGIYLSLHFSGFAAGFLTDTFHITGKYLPILSFIVTFLAVIIVFYIIGKIITKMFDAVALGFFNRLLGLIFGILKAAVLVSLLFFVIQSFDRDEKLITREAKDFSMFYRSIEKVMNVITPWTDLERFRSTSPAPSAFSGPGS